MVLLTGLAIRRAVQIAAVLLIGCAAPTDARKALGRLIPDSKSHLVVEILEAKPCPIAGNAMELYNLDTKMISKVDFSMSFDFNVTRSAKTITEIVLQITRCRDSVSANTCELLFQTWRFNRNPCRDMNDPNAMWKTALDLVKPKFTCPPQKGSYSLQNDTMPVGVLQAIPLPWEGNVWLARFFMKDSPRSTFICSDYQLKVHRVRG